MTENTNTMMIQISRTAREGATSCRKYLLCLKGDRDLFCRGPATPEGLYIEEHSLFDTTACRYHVTDSAGNPFCRCPVRIEMRERHGI